MRRVPPGRVARSAARPPGLAENLPTRRRERVQLKRRSPGDRTTGAAGRPLPLCMVARTRRSTTRAASGSSDVRRGLRRNTNKENRGRVAPESEPVRRGRAASRKRYAGRRTPVPHAAARLQLPGRSAVAPPPTPPPGPPEPAEATRPAPRERPLAGRRAATADHARPRATSGDKASREDPSRPARAARRRGLPRPPLSPVAGPRRPSGNRPRPGPTRRRLPRCETPAAQGTTRPAHSAATTTGGHTRPADRPDRCSLSLLATRGDDARVLISGVCRTSRTGSFERGPTNLALPYERTFRAVAVTPDGSRQPDRSIQVVRPAPLNEATFLETA
jgi:hypothetical protein